MNWLDLRLARQLDRERALDAPELLDNPLGRAWVRAQQAGVPAAGPQDPPILSSQRLRRRVERSERVLRLLDDVLEPMIPTFESLDFALLYADAEGVILDRRAGGGFTETAQAVRLGPGGAWDERSRGTNAIGTAIVEGQAVAVHGPAHYGAENVGLVCYAAPVLDPWGELVGVLDATSFVQRSNPLAAVAVLSAARALEEALRVSALASAGGAFLERMLGRLRDPALLVSPQGRITHVNRAAAARAANLGRVYAVEGDLLRAHAPIDRVLHHDLVDLQAAARDQIRLPGLQVEAVHASDGRIAAYLVVFEPTRSDAPARSTREDARAHAFDDLVGNDPAIVAVRTRAARIARSTLPVLILGETGTGKELVARGLHDASDRAEGPFVAVNCAALTPTLLHSELFGYAGGAFTGAAAEGRAGRLATADGGTLFLDEVAEMPLALQALLLRVLENGVYHRVGDSTPRSTDVRLVCATCRDLPGLVASGSFRADLYYRIRGASMVLPPVRERSDLDLLCRKLLTRLCAPEHPPSLSPAALDRMDAAGWPGNVRELQMTLRHALVMCDGAPRIEVHHLPPHLLELPASSSTGQPLTPQASQVPTPSLAQTRLQAIKQALRDHDGNVSAAARSLGIARSTVYRTLRYGDDTA